MTPFKLRGQEIMKIKSFRIHNPILQLDLLCQRKEMEGVPYVQRFLSLILRSRSKELLWMWLAHNPSKGLLP